MCIAAELLAGISEVNLTTADVCFIHGIKCFLEFHISHLTTSIFGVYVTCPGRNEIQIVSLLYQ